MTVKKSVNKNNCQGKGILILVFAILQLLDKLPKEKKRRDTYRPLIFIYFVIYVSSH